VLVDLNPYVLGSPGTGSVISVRIQILSSTNKKGRKTLISLYIVTFLLFED
jgi:hypothetical protein